MKNKFIDLGVVMCARKIKKHWNESMEYGAMKDDLQKSLKKGFWKRNQIIYLSVGVLNTAVGYGTIFVLLWLGTIPEVANFIGYLLGFSVSYMLNKTFTFQSSASHKRDLPRFALSMSVAYISQFIVLSFLYRFMECNVYLAQILSGGAYVFVGFMMSSKWAFKSESKNVKEE